MNKRSAQISRQTILDTAMHFFADHGYTQASMRGIALTAGISLGGLYLYFKSKEELYLTLLKQWIDAINHRTAAVLAATESAPEALRAFIATSLDFARAHREVLIQGRETEACGGSTLEIFFRHRREIIADIIRDGIASGSFTPCSADETAKIVFCTLRGFFISMAHDDALFSADAFSTLILNGLQARPHKGEPT